MYCVRNINSVTTSNSNYTNNMKNNINLSMGHTLLDNNNNNKNGDILPRSYLNSNPNPSFIKTNDVDLSTTTSFSNDNIQSGNVMDRTINNNATTWDPTETRVFDIYSSNAKKMPFLDVLADDLHPKLLGRQDLTPSNSNNGLNANITPMIKPININNVTPQLPDQIDTSDGIKMVKTDNDDDDDDEDHKVGIDATKDSISKIAPEIEISTHSLSIESPIDPSSSRDITLTTHDGFESEPAISNNSLTAGLTFSRDTTDKWSNEIEDAFITALKLIIKKGTSKIKVRDKNYGRNELISLYIYYHTKEFRTKKQISSHIQVWKKGLNSKKLMSNELTEAESQLYDLIEHGAPRTEETQEKFKKAFNVIIGKLESEVAEDETHQLRESFPMLGPIVRSKSSSVAGDGHDNYSPLITPKSAIGNGSSIIKEESMFNEDGTPKEITFPVTYARSMYEKLPEYKCVPVEIENNDVYRPHSRNRVNKSEGDIYRRKHLSRNDAIEVAAELERKQRALISIVGKALQTPNDPKNTVNVTNMNFKPNNYYNNNNNKDNNNNINNRQVSNTSNNSAANNNINQMSIPPYPSTNYPYNHPQMTQGMSYNSEYYSQSQQPPLPPPQWNGSSAQYSGTIPQIEHTQSMQTPINRTMAQSQFPPPPPPPSQQQQQSTLQDMQLPYQVPNSSRLGRNFTPVETTFPPSTYSSQWYSPSLNQPPSQFNYPGTQYLQNQGPIDMDMGMKGQLQSQQPQLQPPAPGVTSAQQQAPYYQYQSHMYVPGSVPNESPMYPTFNQSSNKPGN